MDTALLFLTKNISDYNIQDIIELQNILEYHSNLYYNNNTSEISDKHYDELLQKLEKLENIFSDILEVQKIEKKSHCIWSQLTQSSFKKVQHSRPMISLWNTYNEDDLKDFDGRVKKNITTSLLQDTINYTLEFKFDWLWVELIYNNGGLIQAITRWDWVEWEDVTQNIFQIHNIPKTITYKEYLEVRGEVVMPLSSFELLNSEAEKNNEKLFSNPRNAASGSLRMKDSRITKKRNLAFFAYDFWDLIISESYFDCIKNLESLWFKISSYFEKSENIQWIINFIYNFWTTKEKLDFEIDWLVVKVNNVNLWEEIWYTLHHPKYAIAYKFPAEILTTIIQSVQHQVGRTWTITPVANLSPITLWWAVIRRATLHNYEECKKLWIWIWDSVFIKRAGEVIPKITWVAKKCTSDNRNKSLSFSYITPPLQCPSCNTDIIKDSEKVRYYCPNNSECFEQKKHRLIYAVGKQWLNIDGLWKAQVQQFLELWLITDLYSIFCLSDKKDEILQLEWFQEKSVNNLLQAIEKKKNISISTLLISLAIWWVWKKTSRELSQLFLSEENILHFHYSHEQLETLEDIGPEISRSMLEFFHNDKNKILLSKLVSILHITYFVQKTIPHTNHIFYNKKMCITGSFENYKRPNLAHMLEDKWGIFVSSISKNTDFLLAGAKAWSKLKKANELWIQILNVQNFIELIN